MNIRHNNYLTIFSNPKPFKGHIGVIQKNALRSWALFKPYCETILFGDEDGIAELAEQYDFLHIPDVQRNQYGTPLISNLFETAQSKTSNRLLCYINADIILVSDFLSTIQCISELNHDIIMIGQRWNLQVDTSLNFDSPDWEAQLLFDLKLNGKLHHPTGIDYIIFSRGIFNQIPPFAIGRALWDNWMIYHSLSRRIPVVDASTQITAIHQNHDYAHLKGGKNEAWKGVEATNNYTLSGGYDHAFTIADATHVISHSKVKRDLRPHRIIRRIISLPFLTKASNPFVKLLRLILKIPRRRYLVS